MQQVSTGYGLIEGPVWDAAKGLYFSDVLGGGIHLLDRKDQISIAVPKRRGVGGMALHADGGLVAGGRDMHRLLRHVERERIAGGKLADRIERFEPVDPGEQGSVGHLVTPS